MAIDLLATLRLKDDFTKTMDKAEKKLGGFESASKKAMGALAGIGVGAGLTALGKNVIQTGMDFDESMSKVKAITGATGKEYEALRDQAKQMGKSTKFSATEAGDAISFLGMAGFKTNEILNALPDTLALASAGGLDLATTADIASNVMSGFNMEAKEMGRIADVLALASASSNTNIQQLGEAMSYSAPVASAFNKSLEESSALIGIVSDAGIQGSRAGMVYKNFLSVMAGAMGTAEKKIAKFGLTMADVNPETNSAVEIIKKLEKAGVSASDAIEIFGAEAGPGVASLLTKGGDAIEEYVKKLEDAEGSAQKMAEIMSDNLAGDIKTLSSTIEGIKIDIFERMDKPLRKAVQGVTALARAFHKSIDPISKFVKANKGMFIGMAIGASYVVKTIAMIVAFKLAVLGLGLLLTPLGLVTSAFIVMGGAIGAVYDRSEDFRNAVTSMGNSLKYLYGMFKGETIADVLGDSSEAKPMDFEAYRDAKNIFESIGTAIGGVQARFTEFKSVSGGLYEHFMSIKFAIDLISGKGVDIDFGDSPEEAGVLADALFRGISYSRKFKDTMRDLSDTLSDMTTPFQSLAEVMTDGFNEDSPALIFFEKLRDLGEVIYNIFSSTLSIFSNLFDALSEGLGNMVDWIMDSTDQFSLAWDNIVDIFDDAIGLVLDVLETFSINSGPIITLVTDLLQILGDIALWAFNYVIAPGLRLAMSLFRAMWAVTGPILNLFWTTLELVGNVIKWVWDNIIKPFVEFLGGRFADTVDRVTGIVDGLAKGFEWLGDKISAGVKWLRDFSGALKNIKMPDWVGKVGGAVGNFILPAKSHYHGLDEVPYDNYPALLHKGEAVMTAQEVRDYNRMKKEGSSRLNNVNQAGVTKVSAEVTDSKGSGGGFTIENLVINSNASDSREVADEVIKRIAQQLNVERSFA